jgi:rhomboid protease GluP
MGMILLGILLLGYALFLFLWQLLPSLPWNGRPLPLWKRFTAVKGALALGLSLVLIYYLTSGGQWGDSSASSIRLFGLNRGPTFHYFQFLTCIFIHGFFGHMFNNVAFIGLFSSYERRKGTGRFFLVFLASGFFSSLLFYPFIHTGEACYGASVGFYGLVAAYCTDFEELPLKEWIIACLVLLAMVGFDTFLLGLSEKDIQINHAGHMLGALGGLLICRVLNGKPGPAGGALTGEAA